ncbi:U-scoloptoxin(19)-Sm1a [Anopheles stephensi]|nr:U-scoloptoxin(19)-Sm1a [Anopheles stephensi]XP_035916743.1 U-scoloptoxin(19)-Sm1a [Anopheles stephensi]XP_035916744.1 U-scoloptoxin(19)-Sm1a [Anopheles stephensi]XP_035916745.1 U-scoloptoxin(19)-Sm1a [Anopheles stephensi]XP_035916746.1 U-scoloptoxin(19)-Sm1a [Anopheles stephensi]
MNSNAVALLLFVALAVCIGDSAEIPPLPVQDDQTAGGEGGGGGGDGGASSSEAQESYLGVKLYKMERPCAMLGGMCVQKSECNSRPGKEGLCPENGHLGVDCCYEVKPAKNLTCHEYRGACMDRCAEGLQRPSVDCTEGQMCCVLVG